MVSADAARVFAPILETKWLRECGGLPKVYSRLNYSSCKGLLRRTSGSLRPIRACEAGRCFSTKSRNPASQQQLLRYLRCDFEVDHPEHESNVRFSATNADCEASGFRTLSRDLLFRLNTGDRCPCVPAENSLLASTSYEHSSV